MSEEMKHGGQAAGTTQPEESGASSSGKTFTQEEVNKIVSDRLARERAKQELQQDPAAEQLAQREKDLTARENRMTCKEYVADMGLDAVLMDIFDTSDAKQFQDSVEKLLEAYPTLRANRPKMKTGLSHSGGHVVGSLDSRLSDAFKP